MNDPHVKTLHYRLETDSRLSIKAPPLSQEITGFAARLEDGMLTIEMKDHHATIESARKAVDSVLRDWEMSANIELDPLWIRFTFENANMIDRAPQPAGPKGLYASAVNLVLFAGEADFHLKKVNYPSLPSRFRVSPDVETMWFRYRLYRDGKEPLLSMAYACLTLLEGSTSVASFRKEVCKMYGIDQDVRNKLGDIVSERGDGTQARKLGGSATKQPLSTNEKTWVEQVVKALITRKAEYDADPSAALRQITLADFINL